MPGALASPLTFRARVRASSSRCGQAADSGPRARRGGTRGRNNAASRRAWSRRLVAMIDPLELQTENYDAMCAFYARALAPLDYRRVTDGPPTGFGTPYAPPFWLRPGT